MTPLPYTAITDVSDDPFQSSTLHLEFQVANSFESISSLAEEWDIAVERLGGPIYMTFGWLKTWWQFYGKGRDLRICIFRSGDQLAGMIPLYIETFGAGPFRTKVARIVGANVPPKTFDPPVHLDHAGQIFARLFEHSFGTFGCDLLSFGPISKIWNCSDSLRAACTKWRAKGHAAEYAARDVRTIFRLPPTFDEFLAAIEPGERKNRLKRLRKLEKETILTEDVVSDPQAVAQEFARFCAAHAKQWNEIGKGGHFQAWPSAFEFNSKLVSEQAAQGRALFFRLIANEEVISSRYTFRFGNVLYSELPARATGPVWDKFGIGVTSLLKFKQQVIAHGIVTVDSGLGSYDHKSGLGGEEIEVGVWRLTGPTPANRLKARLILLFSRLLTFVCHKVWYRRVVPRLPDSVTRTQSMVWLRFDF